MKKVIENSSAEKHASMRTACRSTKAVQRKKDTKTKVKKKMTGGLK